MSYRILRIILLFACVGVTWIVRLQYDARHVESLMPIYGYAPIIDFYTAYKSYFFVAAVTLSCMILAPTQLRSRLRHLDRKLIYLLAASFILLLVAAFGSPVRDLVWWGDTEFREGAFVRACYLALLLLIASARLGDRSFGELWIKILGFTTIGLAALSCTEMYLPKFFLFIVQPLAVGFHPYSSVATLTSLLPTKSAITMFNSNYVGSFCALVAPLFLHQMVVKRTSREAAAFGAAIVLLFLSASLTGIVGAAAGMGLVAFRFYRSTSGIPRKPLFIGIAAFVVLAAISEWHRDFRTVKKVGANMEQLVASFLAKPPETDPSQAPNGLIRGIEMRDNDIVFAIGSRQLVVRGRLDSIQFLNGELNPIQLSYASGEARFEEEGLRTVTVDKLVRFGVQGLRVTDGIQSVDLGMSDRGLRVFDGRVLIKPMTATKIPQSMNDHLFTGRGYIWSRAIPIVLRQPLKGCGPGCFVALFPQDDYWNKVQVYKGMDIAGQRVVIDKIHSLYLNYAFETGIPSLLLFLALISYVSRKNLKGMRSFADVSLGLCSGIMGYLVAGIGNDSTICVAPVFWSALGLLSGTINQPGSDERY